MKLIGINVSIKHNKKNIKDADVVVYSSAIKKNNEALKKSGTWKVSDWRNFYKDGANRAVAASTLDYKLIPNSANGFDFRLPGGTDNINIRREVERQSLKHFVLGTIGAGKLQDSNFLAMVQSVGANVTGLGNPGSGEKLIPGMTYKRNDGTRIVYTGQKDAKGEFINIELLSTTPTYK